MKLITRALIVLFATTICACGWQLRGTQNYAAPKELHVISPDRYSPLTLSLLEAMQQRAISNSGNAFLQLHIGKEALKKRTVAVTNIGSPSQYELSLSVDYKYLTKGNTESITVAESVSVYRVFDFNPSNTLAKSEEENTLLDEMRQELAHRILQKTPILADDGQT